MAPDHAVDLSCVRPEESGQVARWRNLDQQGDDEGQPEEGDNLP
ncbi:MAG: hypothetical protein ACRDVK_11910 [Acidimicrobiia bacterium]